MKRLIGEVFQKMSVLRKGLAVIRADIHVAFLKLKGINIKADKINLINAKSVARTFNGGSIKIGFRTCISPNTEISARGGVLSIGSRCFVNRNCIISAHDQIEIGDNVTIGPGTYIYDHDHDGKGGYVTNPVKIGDNVWIGAGCIILKGVTIGAGAVIAAGCLISRDIPEGAKVIQKRETSIT